MMSTGWNPWKITAIGLGLVVTTALIIGVGVANWSGREGTQKHGAIGAVIGAAVGPAGGAIVDGGSGASQGAVIGGVLGGGHTSLV
jgi:hypothetical protein